MTDSPYPPQLKRFEEPFDWQNTPKTPDIPPINLPIYTHMGGTTPTPGDYQGDIGLDMYACLAAPVHLEPLQGDFIPAGFSISLPKDYAALVLGRSSSNRAGLLVFTGVIDNGFQGELGAEVRNISTRGIDIRPGDRIAQLVLVPAYRPRPVEVERYDFRSTDRGEQGFGSSGR